MKPLAVLIAVLAALSLLVHPAVWSADDLKEIYRIRVANEVDGPVQVSLDQGKSYATMGRVTHPATDCTRGFAASRYAQAGRVAAVAVHAIRIKAGSVPGPDGSVSLVFSIIPREFSPGGSAFDTGEVAGASGIYTDIPTGTAIFRNLSPLVGNPVYLESRGVLKLLPPGYRPSVGDTLVIIAMVHERRPNELIFENRKGGKVEAVYKDSREVIASVERPVLGVGRFDATEYTGVGGINTNHTGVITVSTAPLLKKGTEEPRGGFQILPSKHAVHIGWIPQYMVVGPSTPDSPALEGAPMLFSGYIGLAHDPESAGNSFRVDVRVGDSDWRPLSALTGKHDKALLDYAATGKPVSHIRLRLPEYSPDWLDKQIRSAADAYVRAKYGNKPPARGVLNFSLAGADTRGVRFASFYVDGQFRGISSTAPYSFSIDADSLLPGEHRVEIRASNEAGAVVKSTKQWFHTVSDRK